MHITGQQPAEHYSGEMREYLRKDISFFKDETLEAFRGRIERGELSAYYDTEDPPF